MGFPTLKRHHLFNSRIEPGENLPGLGSLNPPRVRRKITSGKHVCRTSKKLILVPFVIFK